jgi:hypothetical protein
MQTDFFDVSFCCIICDVNKTLDINLSIKMCCIKDKNSIINNSNARNVRKGGTIQFPQMLDKSNISAYLFDSLLIFNIIFKWINV